MLIVRAAPIMKRVYNLKRCQSGEGGHVANVVQGAIDLLNRLPRSSTNVLVLVVRRDGNKNGR